MNININDYAKVIYVDSTSGNDASGDGSVNSPYASVEFAKDKINVDNTLIYIKKGNYDIVGGLSVLTIATYKVTYYAETSSSIKNIVNFNLKSVATNRTVRMTSTQTFIGIVFKLDISNAVWEYYFDSALINLEFINCVFDKGTFTPTAYVIYTGNSSGATYTKLNYINCTITAPSLSGIRNSSNTRKGEFIGCSIADSNLTIEANNLLSATINSDYSTVNDQSRFGVYHGSYAWQEILNKTLILQNGEYKKWKENTAEIVSAIPVMTSNTTPSGTASASSKYNDSYDAWKAFNGGNNIHANAWLTNTAVLTGWLAYDFGASIKKKIVKYGILPQVNTSGGNFTTKSPKNWTFEGSDDGLNWTVLDTRTNITGWVHNDFKEFSLINNNSYQRYRINVTANSGDVNGVAIGQMKMFEEIPSTPPSWQIVSSTLPTVNQFVDNGMDSLSPLLDRKVMQLEPQAMTVKIGILPVGSTAKVFSKKLDLNKYIDVRKIEVK